MDLTDILGSCNSLSPVEDLPEDLMVRNSKTDKLALNCRYFKKKPFT